MDFVLVWLVLVINNFFIFFFFFCKACVLLYVPVVVIQIKCLSIIVIRDCCECFFSVHHFKNIFFIVLESLPLFSSLAHCSSKMLNLKRKLGVWMEGQIWKDLGVYYICQQRTDIPTNIIKRNYFKPYFPYSKI